MLFILNILALCLCVFALPSPGFNLNFLRSNEAIAAHYSNLIAIDRSKLASASGPEKELLLARIADKSAKRDKALAAVIKPSTADKSPSADQILRMDPSAKSAAVADLEKKQIDYLVNFQNAIDSPFTTRTKFLALKQQNLEVQAKLAKIYANDQINGPFHVERVLSIAETQGKWAKDNRLTERQISNLAPADKAKIVADLKGEESKIWIELQTKSDQKLDISTLKDDYIANQAKLAKLYHDNPLERGVYVDRVMRAAGNEGSWAR